MSKPPAHASEPAPPRKPSLVKRLLKTALGILLIVMLGLVLYGMIALRDRNPGYEVALHTDPNPSPPPLQVGFAKTCINPDLSNLAVPVYLAGFSQNRRATAIHDDLWALACVLASGDTRLGIVALDAIGFFHDEVIQVRQRLEPGWGLDYVVICSTHNHNTPDLMGLWGPHYLKSGVNNDYREQVIQACVNTLSNAVALLQPAQVAFHEIPTPTEGLVGDSRRPIVFDPDIRVMHFTSPSNGLTLGTIIGWASHPETVWSRNTEITADYPGYLRDALEKGVTHDDILLEPGLGGTHLFINGAIGGLMSTGPGITVHDPYLQQDFKEPTHDKARALGRNLAFRILAQLEKPATIPATNALPIGIRARTFAIPLANPGYLAAPLLGLIDRGHVRWKQIRTEAALLTLGDVSIGCIPGEIYPELVNGGVENPPGADFNIDPIEIPPLRELMPGRLKFIFGLANDEIGYIIPKSEWDNQPPYLYNSKRSLYGEINSCGPEVARVLHEVFQKLCTQP